jgi:DNA polymerase
MTERLLFFDTETFCQTPIQVGTHRYAEDVEIIVASWAVGMFGPVKVADLTDDDGIGCKPLPDELVELLRDPGVTIIGHNFGNFDRTVLRHAIGTEIAPERIIDTMVQAMSHGLPGGLEKLGDIFGVSEADAKMKEGKDLIKLFCKPMPKNQTIRRATKVTHPDEWAIFLRYAGSDISSMRHIFYHMPKWNYPGVSTGNRLAPERALWCLDQRINDRGFAVDTDLARAAVEAVNADQKVLNDRTDTITGGDVARATQRDRLLKHLLAEWGVDLPDMTKTTLERRVNDENLPDPVRELIAIRLEASQTSTSKYNALVKGVSADGRLRGTLQFCGASRTGRWAGRVFQPQNLPRPDMPADEIEMGIEALKGGYADVMFDSRISLASNAIRGCIIAPPDKKLVIADLSNIEGRVLAWLAGEEWKLQAFRDYDRGEGPDLYLVTAGNVLGKAPGEVTKDERQSHGKVPELACGYQGSIGAFASMAALYGMDIPEWQVAEIVDGWRDKNQKIVNFWWQLQDAAIETTLTGQETRVGRYIRFTKVGNWLRAHLPSGRVLCYADARMIEDPRFKGRQTLSYMGLNSYTKRFERLTTYGGKWAEQLTQATARDVMAHGMLLAEDNGYPIILTVHDELLTETLDTPNYSVSVLSRLMSRTPDWADDRLPLAAAGFETYRYRKG